MESSNESNNKTDWIVLRSRYIPALWPFMIYWTWDVEGEIGVDKVQEVHAWKEGLTWAVWSAESLKQLGQRTVELLKKQDKEELRKKGKVACEKVLEFCKDFSKNDHTIQEYIYFYNKFTELYADIMRYNMVWWVFSGKALERKLSQKLSEDDLRILSKPTEKSYSQVEEDEFEVIVKKARTGVDVSADIKVFTEKYYWFPYEYVGPDIWTVESVTARVKEEVAKPEVKEKEEKLPDIKLDSETKEDLELLRFVSILQDDRKMYNSHICYYLNEVIAGKLAKVLGVKKELARLAEQNALEMSDVNEELKKRSKFLVVGRKSAGENFFFPGKLGEEFLEKEKIILPIAKEGETEVKGRVAYKAEGKVCGHARILTNSQCKDFKEGEIIITGMTTPDFVSLVKKAAAIVTDEGGITCHASIVARELKKPCVIGTKIATQVFKDGDLIEVDAEKGIIRKL